MSRCQLLCFVSAVGALWATGCASRAIPPAPEPLRPQEIRVAKTEIAVPTDCGIADLREQPPSVPYRDRSIEEAKNLADQGLDQLKRSENAKLPRSEREGLLADAVDRFITSLKADPYNVHATYNLAAAYARIGRAQCAVNLLERMAAMHKLRSLAPAVEAKLDRLLGRGRYRNDMDADFDELRDQDIFREVIKKFQK